MDNKIIFHKQSLPRTGYVAQDFNALVKEQKQICKSTLTLQSYKRSKHQFSVEGHARIYVYTENHFYCVYMSRTRRRNSVFHRRLN